MTVLLISVCVLCLGLLYAAHRLDTLERQIGLDLIDFPPEK